MTKGNRLKHFKSCYKRGDHDFIAMAISCSVATPPERVPGFLLSDSIPWNRIGIRR
jgi:hypothetical protein